MFCSLKMANKSLYFLLILYSNYILSQEITESKFWSSASYKYQSSEKLSFSISQLYRVKDDLKAVDSYISEISSDYVLSKDLNFEIELRYYSKNDNKGSVQGFENLWRYRLALEKELKFKPIKIYLRFAFQRRSSLDRDNSFKEYIRARSALEYSIKNWDWDPYFSLEIINKTSGNSLQKIRYGFGSSNKIKASKWTIRYFYQVNKTIPKENYHIMMLKYRYKQKSKKLKKIKEQKLQKKLNQKNQK
tara:strand:- start:77 stop:817 length:741 start_codon:yes stop_codon:yes gene_type:complete